MTLFRIHGLDVNSVMSGVFLPGCNGSGMGAIHCGKHTRVYARYVRDTLRAADGDKTAVINAFNSLRESLLYGELRLNRH